jgi:Holliday junction resolvase-like predicted endonuclease
MRMRWQEFEEKVKEIFDRHGYETKFRLIFRDSNGKGEIDVVAEKFGLVLGIDAKKYAEHWHRASTLKKQAEKHAERCTRFGKLKGKDVIPVIVSFIDDSIFYHSGCIVVPFEKLNDFLLNIHAYMLEFAESESEPVEDVNQI